MRAVSERYVLRTVELAQPQPCQIFVVHFVYRKRHFALVCGQLIAQDGRARAAGRGLLLCPLPSLPPSLPPTTFPSAASLMSAVAAGGRAVGRQPRWPIAIALSSPPVRTSLPHTALQSFIAHVRNASGENEKRHFFGDRFFHLEPTKRTSLSSRVFGQFFSNFCQRTRGARGGERAERRAASGVKNVRRHAKCWWHLFRFRARGPLTCSFFLSPVWSVFDDVTAKNAV